MNILIKRLLDIISSVLLLVVLSPFFLIITFFIKIDSKGSVIFKQKRLKRDGAEFYMYKFRSMIQDAEKQGTGLFNFKNDYRVTKVGRVLRNTSLDELPQLINVLKGDMSFVGPRPPVSYELGNYEDLNDVYKRRFMIRPGVTGLAQVAGRNELEWDEKVILDNEYIDLFKRYGILIDLKILFKTIFSVFLSKNIYEEEDKTLEGLSDEEKADLAMQKIIAKAKERKLNENEQ